MAEGHTLALMVYRASANSPRGERYGLTAQMRRSAVSVPSNIAEGCGRRGADFGRFMQIAMGSASELEYQMLLARDLELMQAPEYGRLEAGATQVKRMLAALIAGLSADCTGALDLFRDRARLRRPTATERHAALPCNNAPQTFSRPSDAAMPVMRALGGIAT